ncbi:AbfB domain-containing protein [Actinoplanes sp. CA-051413]|uniref:AbfB domain-containing protein n=1 Tax=Actinoplanes sp. CA-051413 TaxID=3239899 RepID=UPI003D98628A
MSYQQPGRSRGRPGSRAGRSPAQPRSSAVIVGGAVLAVLAMVLVIVIERRQHADTAPDASGAWIAPPVADQSPAVIPLQSATPSPSGAPDAAATGKPLPVARPSSSRPAPRRTPPARLLPGPGSRISLVAVGSPGLRLRHQDFRMRLTAIGPRSPALARADATFVLRRGLADARCVSLEAVNFPGRFMRHRNFVAVLQPRERSSLFAADATFCPQAAGTDGTFVLRSSNFPDRHLIADSRSVRLAGPAIGPAQKFRAEPGL